MGKFFTAGKQVLQDHGDGLASSHMGDMHDEVVAKTFADAMNDRAPKFDYMAEADKTCSVVFGPEFVDPIELVGILNNVIGYAEDMNLLKKLFFRGKRPEELGLTTPLRENSMGPALQNATPETINIIHGIIGVITEAGEMAELLRDFVVDGGEFDRVHLLEEAGDVYWYLARQLRGIGADVHMMGKTNIDKLHGRHGDAFDVFRDANRNLGSERERLEVAAAPLFEKVEDAIMPEMKRPATGDASDMVDRIAAAASTPRVRNDPPLPPGLASLAPVERIERKPIGDCEGTDC